MTVKPWEKHGSREVGDFRVFSVRADRKTSPRTGCEHEFFVINSTNWVNVIALTADAQLILVEQFRHGTETVELEVPGGIMDPGETDPLATATRELREETGYVGTEAQLLGQVYPNPAIMGNICYTALVRDCRLKCATQFDHSEDLVTRLVPVGEIPNLVAAGRIRHALVLVALYHFEVWRARPG